MHILFPFHPGDVSTAESTLRWVGHLGVGKNHDIILMPSKALKGFDVAHESAKAAFRTVEVFRDSEGVNGHPEGPNCMMRQAVWHLQTSGIGPCMFQEPDCIPLTADAYDQWEREYRAFGKPFMGELRPASGVTPDYLTGNMMVPKGALLLAPMLARRGLSNSGVELAFDIVAASQILPQAHLTKLLQQVPKNADGSSHTFKDQASLSLLRLGAVFFHPCKDGSLVERLLEKEQGFKWNPEVHRHLIKAGIAQSAEQEPPKLRTQLHSTELSEIPEDIFWKKNQDIAHLQEEIAQLESENTRLRSLIPTAAASEERANKAAVSEKLKAAWVKRKAKAAKKAARKAKAKAVT